MTNKEIKLELAKVALMKYNYANTDDLSLSVKYLYDWITEEPETEVDMSDKRIVDYNKESIREVIKYIYRNNYNSRNGFGVRAVNTFGKLGIETVGQLLDLTRAEFIKTRDVGSGLLKLVNNALFELYGIEKW